MDITIATNTTFALHLSDIYQEKKPGEYTYQQKYCNNGYIIFHPFHSYMIPIWEYSTRKIHKMTKETEIFSKFSKSSILMNFTDDVENTRWILEYINPGDIWMFSISNPIAKITPRLLEFEI